MATLNYRIKNTQKNPTVIYVRFKHSKEHDYEIPTGFYVDKRRWSKAKQQINLSEDTKETYDDINSKLRLFRDRVINDFNSSQANGITINREWLEKSLQSFFERTDTNADVDKSIFFSDFFEWYVVEILSKELNPKTSKPRSIRTIQDHNTTLKKLKHFEIIHKKKYKHVEIDRNFHREFINYCTTYHSNNMKTIGGEIDNIRQVLKRAEIEGYKVNQDYKKGLFFSPDNETHDIALSKQDIDKITNHDFSNNDRLDNARDWLIIGIWTGLRVSDLLKLNKSKINDVFFELENHKTGIFVVIPIHADVQKILDKRKGFPRKISDQKFNNYIKEVAKAAGLTEIVKGARKVKVSVKGYGNEPADAHRKEVGNYPKHELVSSHICRRTFATLHYGKLDTLTIMKITGHTTEKQFLEYVKISPREHAQKMKELWNNMNKSK